MPADALQFARVRSASGDHLRAAADTVVQRPWGWAVVTPSLPGWLDLNMVVLDGDTAGLEPADVEDLCAELLGGLPPAAEVWEPESPDRLAPAGWTRDAFALLAHAGPVPEPGLGVYEVSREAVTDLRRRWLAEQGRPPALLDLAARAEARMFTRTPTRAFAVLHGGAPVACALLVGAGPERMVENVYVLPPARGRGLAGVVVRGATAAAYATGADLVWLATDDGGRAMRVYQRLGFEPVLRATRITPG